MRVSAALLLSLGSTICLGRPAEPKARSPEADRLVEARRLLAVASAAYGAGDFAKAAESYAAAYDAGATAPTVPYNTACCFARLGRVDEAFRYLDRAVEQGWRNADYLERDADLGPLRADARWAGLVRRSAANREAFRQSMSEPDLYDELMKRMESDQRERTAAEPNGLTMMLVDRLNTAWLKGVVEKHGWPGHTMVGRDGAQAAWLLVQHADHDHAFQRRCLELLTQAYEKGDAAADQVAYLTDRVLVAEGKPQLYGTQFHTVHGKLQPYPIENAGEVDQRRNSVGLGPLDAYAEKMRSHDKR